LHPSMSAHGPDAAVTEAATKAELAPRKIEGALAFMFETRAVLRPTRAALEITELQRGYDACWSGMPRYFPGEHS
ncbi:MAG: homogentisate 1,2-dioxygenase domain-containing protein, partial [Acetobacteraceae bacterium]